MEKMMSDLWGIITTSYGTVGVKDTAMLLKLLILYFQGNCEFLFKIELCSYQLYQFPGNYGAIQTGSVMSKLSKSKVYQLVTSLHNTTMTAKENSDFFFLMGKVDWSSKYLYNLYLFILQEC
jgi:hypothetical protein